ncbi:HNH endonuclease [Parasediminibacterium paludis]|uniref:HNH endonuclease n=1 Tax=Parasediminibacterium paludis TaxID=908966 RepID=A0ABV8PXH7_9BACT
MIKLLKPDYKVEEVYLLCLSNYEDADKKQRLTDCKDFVVKASNDYEQYAKTNSLNYFIPVKVTKQNKNDKIINDLVSVEELNDVYTNKFAAKGSPGRHIYDKIKTIAKLGTCPLCCHRDVTQLDHYLPKANHPLLSVTPINLVPSCSDCNKIKLANSPSKKEEETIHPYYDDLENSVWLNANVIQSTPPTIVYSVIKPLEWDDTLFKRVQYHFEILQLNDLYSVQAAKELVEINHSISEKFGEGGSEAVKKYLSGEAISRSKTNKNSWKAALYTVISKDDWYCSEGFQHQVQ